MRESIYVLAVLLFLIIDLPGSFCQSSDTIRSMMESYLREDGKKPVHSFLLFAESTTTGKSIHEGVGTIGSTPTAVNKHFQFNIASITKTVVATLILQLVEEGHLDLDDKVSQYLSTIDSIRFDEMHQIKRHHYSSEISIRMLLQHTSGIADLFTDASIRFNLSVYFHKKRQYSPVKIIKKFFRLGLHRKAKNRPGKGYHYSDMNYMLLGFILEKLYGKTLAEIIRERILIPMEMTRTYFEYYEPAVTQEGRIDSYLNRINITQKVNTSYEWAGGGLVSTTEDMAKFMKGLFSLQLLRQKVSLELMLDASKTQAFGGNYGLGIYQYDFGKDTFYGHGGFYGSLLVYEPREGVLISANIGQANLPYSAEEVLGKILHFLRN